MLRVEEVKLHRMAVVLNDGAECAITSLYDRSGHITDRKTEAAAGVAHDTRTGEWMSFNIMPRERYQ